MTVLSPRFPATKPILAGIAKRQVRADLPTLAPERRGSVVRDTRKRFCSVRREPIGVIEVNLRRGFVRLGIGLAVLWFVFWTCAYVMRPLASEDAQPLPALSPTTDIALIAVAVVGLPWIFSGFRSN